MKITEPTLVLDVDRYRANIRRMAEKARRFGVKLKPHFKTHQSQQTCTVVLYISPKTG